MKKQRSSQPIRETREQGRVTVERQQKDDGRGMHAYRWTKPTRDTGKKDKRRP